ncbi:MAG: hypothetical protein OXS28_05335 [Gammaproteobacteria bacterium]|nr:hypothetical protein [Gammaproteobacteria bacterium]
MSAGADEKLAARLAVEALRNGVPNREAVRELGCNQSQAEEHFSRMLDGVADIFSLGRRRCFRRAFEHDLSRQPDRA